ncbi:MAG: hypothetical protein RR752_05130, partial [Mucinivorans sp.]
MWHPKGITLGSVQTKKFSREQLRKATFSRTGSEKRSFQEQLRKTKFSRTIKKNEVFQEKFWVTFSKV